MRIAQHAEEVGLDVFATGEHHNPPFVPSSPTTMLGYLAARTSRIILSMSTTLITTNDPAKIAVDETPLTVGSPQQVIEKTLTFRESFGSYQRQLFLIDHAGLPLKTVL
ncbi:MAG TPA: LLM class flavin-dependent oxidoreductase [Jiangellaceae bacterium]|nr:LLM class flavin-dependent oxidoreductase [Jiangellaceae bacterium]